MQVTQHLLGGSNPSFVHEDRLGSPGGGRTRSLTPGESCASRAWVTATGAKASCKCPSVGPGRAVSPPARLAPTGHPSLCPLPTSPMQTHTPPAAATCPSWAGVGGALLWCEWRGGSSRGSLRVARCLRASGVRRKVAAVGSQTLCPLLDVPAGQLPRGRRSQAKIPLTGMGFQEVSSDSGTQGGGQECGLGVPEGLAKCLLSLVDLG